MATNYGTDPEKMLDWDKNLGEQSDYVKKAIEPLLTWEWAYTKECMDIGHYYGNEDYKNFWETKSVEDPDYVKEYILKEFNVGDLYDKLSRHGNDYEFASIKLKSLGIEGIRHGDKVDHIFKDEYFEELDKENTVSDENEWENEQPPVSDRQLETAQKTGYVQGVCESVLAFNNDENRKIMSEATMTFLSKKLLSEMNVTKNMAQKFANPETYKALEQCVFAPKQEQHLEQTQSRGRGL